MLRENVRLCNTEHRPGLCKAVTAVIMNTKSLDSSYLLHLYFSYLDKKITVVLEMFTKWCLKLFLKYNRTKSHEKS